MKCTKLIQGLASIVVFVTMAELNRAQEVAPDSGVRETNREVFFAKFALVDYYAPLPENPDELEQRRIKNRRYDNENWVLADPDPETDYAKRSIAVRSLPTFPNEESDLVVIGRATAVSAHLSNDKTGIYSEYKIRIEQVLKDDLSRNLAPGSVITIDRAGGAVRYPGGHRVAYLLAEKKLPTVGASYALFLRDDKLSKNFEVVTLYELKVNSVAPLDTGFTFEEVRGMTKDDFLQSVHGKLVKRADN
jgi:hypothetical protein